MQKWFIKALLLACIIISSEVQAQYKYAAGLGGSHERLFNAYGNHVRLYYNFTDNFRMNAEFVRYYEVEEKKNDEAFGYDYRELNLGLSYILLFGEKQKFGTYVLLGFTYNYGRTKNITPTDTNERFTESAGMTFGIGALYKIGHFMPYIESRNISSGINNYLVHTVGVAYMFGKRED